jgi:hypothetical protein
MTRPGHDTADTDTYGGHMGCGPTHDVLATMFFGGRRPRVHRARNPQRRPPRRAKQAEARRSTPPATPSQSD